MASPTIIAAASGFYHVIAHVATGPRPSPADYARALDSLMGTLDRHVAPLVAYCLVPGRCHLLLGPIGPTRLARLREWVGRTHAMPLHAIAELVPRVRHIERAARTAGLVARAEAWPWSSLAQRRDGRRRPVLVDGGFLHSDAWLDYVNASLTPAERAADHPPPVVRSA
jgi:hypothetical protein